MSRFTLPEHIDIRHVAPLREALVAASATGPLVLDASAVERVDTAGVQLLTSALLADPPAASSLVDASPALRQALVTLGLAEVIPGAPSETPAPDSH
ncbi:MAG: STAS domain-containing protein [Gammaproteobacteria bacterium]|nr:STAS domain-containing protein [Gammaproteobacteria bacterium]